MDEEKLFDEWNKNKKLVQLREISKRFYPTGSEVWMCILGKNIGFEQNGGGDNFSRPCLVIKKFNNQMFLIAPLSTKQKKLDFYYNFTDPNSLQVSVILAQIRLLSIKRFKRRMYNISVEDFELIKKRCQKFFS